MSASKATYKTLVTAAIFLFSAHLAQAQATRTWVSGVGDDANPCSRTAPCKTFAGAISKTAAKGEINVLDPGGFGAVTITKSITISSEGFEAGVLVSGTNGIVVSAGASDVIVLRGLDIEGLGTGLSGIRFLAGGALHVENCTINDFTLKGIDFEPSGSSQLHVVDTIIRSSTASPNGVGVLIKPTATGTAKATFNHVNIDHNLVGLRVEGPADVTAVDTTASGNTNNGFLAVSVSGLSAELNLDRCTAAYNGVAGMRADGSNAIIRMSQSVSTGNANGLSVANSGQIISFGNNRNSGNTIDGAPTSTIGEQ